MRLSDAINTILRKEQAGFRPGVGCIGHIFTLRNIIEQYIEWNTKVHINFIDLEKAFDSIHRDTLWRILLAYAGVRREDYQHHQMFLKQFLLQCYSYEKTNGLVQERGAPRLRAITHVILSSHRLDNAQDNRQQKTGHQMDTNVFA